MQISLPHARQWALGLVALVVAAIAYWWLSVPAPATTVPVKVAPASRAAMGSVIVDVQGAVRRAGVIRLPAGARVIDAVNACGGLLPGHAAVVNLARPVVDGEQIVVGADTTSTAAPNGSGKVNVNRADVAALDALPGIGAVLAQRIVDYRSKHGPFHTLRDLLEVPGIGDAKYANIADAISIG